MCAPTLSSSVQKRGLVGSDDSMDFNFGPLHQIVVGFSSADIKKQLELEPARIDEQDWTGRTPLMWAAVRDDPVTVQILLSHHADLKLKDGAHMTALTWAARYSPDCVRLLLDAGADPNVSDIYDQGPLHCAVDHQLPQSRVDKIISDLQSYHADIEARDKDGMTALFLSVTHPIASGFKALVKFGADINALNYEGDSPISRAIFGCNYEVIETLCGLGARLSWETTSNGANNVLKSAAKWGTVDAMNILAACNSRPIDYDPDEIWIWFNEYRNHGPSTGERFSLDEKYGRFSLDEERAAFQNLLDKKGNKVNIVSKIDEALGTEADEPDSDDDETEPDFDNEGHQDFDGEGNEQDVDVEESESDVDNKENEAHFDDEGNEQNVNDGKSLQMTNSETTQVTDNEEETECFEDALEDLSLSN
jgi:ankyrin repeat protein